MKSSNTNLIDIVKQISIEKKEPDWMLEIRIKALEFYLAKSVPEWGPDLSELNMEDIAYYTSSTVTESKSWAELPSEISDTFEKLGIPKAEREYLGGVGAQYDSNMVYHKILDSLSRQGVIFENMDNAVHKYPELVREHFSKCIQLNEHKFIALHYAFWSGGTFIYVPKNVKVNMPLQAYFRMNREKSAQFEHTLIIADEGSEIEYIEGCSAPKYNFTSLHAGGVEIFVKERAKVKYSSIENWSKNVYNLNTKKALVYDDAEIDWLGGNLGSKVTMLYPTSVLIGDNSKSSMLSIVLAGSGQVQDVGAKVIHIGKNTSSIIKSKSVSRLGGIANYRGHIEVNRGADNAISSVVCDGVIADQDSVSNTWPSNKILGINPEISHEAKVGRISDDHIFYLGMYGFSEYAATHIIINGFLGEITKRLPIEYAVEFKKLIELELS